MRIESELVGRTFGDFLLRPQEGAVDTRRSIPLCTRLTTELQIGIPIMAANMDSVTEESMARTLAVEGGIGIIHRGMSITSQAD